MIRTEALNEQMRQQRCQAKTLDNLFRRRIEAGANCAPFVSEAILQTAKEIFPLEPDATDSQLGLGQIKLLVVAATEPAGKSMKLCQKVTVRLTLDAGQDDFEVRIRRGVVGLRRARLLRLAVEAREQGGLLSYEDLGYRLLNCGLRTIVRDVRSLRRAGIEVPTRGQQQDIGPGQTHRVQAVRVPYLALIAFWAVCCRFVIRSADVCYTQNLAKLPSNFIPLPASRILLVPRYPAPPPSGKITIFAEDIQWDSSHGFTATPRNSTPWPNGSSRPPVRTARSSALSFATAFCTALTRAAPNEKHSAPGGSFAATARHDPAADGPSPSGSPTKSDASH